MESAAARKEWRAVPDAPLRTNGAEDAAERVKMAQSEGRAIYEDGAAGLEDFCSITIDGSGGLSEDILQKRLQNIVHQRKELEQVEIELRAQAIAHPQIIEVQRSFGVAAKEHAAAVADLKDQLHQREKYILELQMKLDDKERELDALKIDHQTVWANQDLLREQTKELASVRERDNSEAERNQHLKQIHDLQEHLREKETQFLALEEQHRAAQDNSIYKDEQLREAHAWIARVQEMDILQSQALQAELRERTEQFTQCWANFQQQFVEMQQSYHHTIQRLSVQIHEMRLLANEQEDNLQAAQEGSPDSSYVQNKGDNLAGNGSALADGNQSMTNNGSPDDFTKGNNAHAVPVVPSSLLGIGGFVPPGQMAGMHSYMLHPQGIAQSLAPPNSGVPQFGTFQPSIQPSVHWPNQQEAHNVSPTPDATIYQPSQSDQTVLQSGASKNSELSSKQSQVAHPEYPTAHAEQQQRSPSIIAEQTHEPKVVESNVTEHLVYNEEQKAQDSSSNASSTGKFEHQEETAELKGEKVTSGKQSVEQVPRKQNQASDITGSTTQVHSKNIMPELKSNVVNQADSLTLSAGGAGSLLPSIQKEPALLDERSLLACIVRAVPAGSDNRIRISSTLPNRLGKMLAPLHWHDYKKRYGKLDDFVASHNELFVIEGDFIYLREGAQQIISATTAAAKIAAAAAASSASYSTLLPSVAVTPVAQVNRQKRGPVVDSRTSNSMPSGNGSTTGSFGDQQGNGFLDEVRPGQSSRHTAANGGRHERAGLPAHDKGAGIRHGYGGKQQGRSTGTEYNSRR
ncbi:uncharacterized protein LOC100831359 isoform X2 [Brachypodium distachyon]|uniref:uncharacterized protein LOC100831359 isoform X2 n=1 Tax=Brachypodium distachyon TaxID=15368 RepID=UPI00052FEE71|nr:uncharacterized protein LOC100831359 isoform X2 [Brachypodium distachyon]|eukprot:XP_010235365.1 uncharacterized protein LOC100831359 isoform X2 [Brachypodium distachyon]